LLGARKGQPLRVGLVNNMPDAAMEAAERQFAALMQAAAGARGVEVVPLALDGVARGEAGRARLASTYRPADEIATLALDALVITGAEPRAARLRDEPFWDAFAELVDAAEGLGLPVLFSCLAAHAAVLCRDGIERRPLGRKASGVFAFARAGSDRLLEGAGRHWRTPHSRWNGLDEADLVAEGYSILARSPEIGVDAFAARVGGARWLFLQGHPEYEAKTLLLETRRDLQRYLAGERDSPPDLPPGVFAAGDLGEAALGGLLGEARLRRTPELLDRWPSWAAPAPAAWRAPAAALCRNWLASADVELSRERRSLPRPAPAYA
jgi:homoserine O-succinyltransferase